MAGARSLHIRDRLNPIPDVIRTTRRGLQSKEHRSVPHEEILGDALGKYVGGVIPGGYAQEQDGEAGDPPTDHSVPRGHPAGDLAHLFTDSPLLHGQRVRVDVGGGSLGQATFHVLKKHAETQDALVTHGDNPEFGRCWGVIAGADS